MWWLLAVGGLLYFRGNVIAQKLAAILPNDDQKILYQGNSMAVSCAVIFVVLDIVTMVMPVGVLFIVKRPAYLFCIWSSILCAMYSIKVKCGAPPVPQNLSWSSIKSGAATAALQPWLQKAMTDPEGSFLRLFFALIFLTAAPSYIALAIIGRRALWFVGNYCDRTSSKSMIWRLFNPTWAKLKAQQVEILKFASTAEIALAFWLTASLFLPSRQILTCILYWNYLKTRYQAEAHAGMQTGMYPGAPVTIHGLSSKPEWDGQAGTLAQPNEGSAPAQGRVNVRCPDGSVKALKFENLQFGGASAGKESHVQAWKDVGRQCAPILKALPFLNKPIDMAKGWFQPPAPVYR